ncbi:hypothetical protein JD844_034189 [Phrynosoma platyrhinos]|uniref:Uncharacterized protein n=1 Tax=Phrynosoma platyrhinos TaxID=52577 RepID=A0ABQ7T9G1_PHRPL|nr:hypothetical protein JD844_034189 [Phrynosoma platyrhinos]
MSAWCEFSFSLLTSNYVLVYVNDAFVLDAESLGGDECLEEDEEELETSLEDPETENTWQSLVSEGEEEELAEEEEDDAKGVKTSLSESLLAKKVEEKTRKQQGKSLAELHGTGKHETVNRTFLMIAVCFISHCRSPHTLVEVTSFAALNKFQPFNVAISSNVLLLLDFHSHLTKSEVVGYLGGRWDINSQCPYFSGNQGVESKISPFWVMPPPEQRPYDYGIPMEVEVTYVQDGFLTNDILHEMVCHISSGS